MSRAPDVDRELEELAGVIKEGYVSAINVKCLLFLLRLTFSILASRTRDQHTQKHSIFRAPGSLRDIYRDRPDNIVIVREDLSRSRCKCFLRSL
jgi:hypothetical protein